MDDFLFLPDRYAGYPLTILEARALFTRMCFDRVDWEMMPVEAQREHLSRSATHFWWKLAGGELHSFAQSNETGGWFRVPSSYWIEDRGGVKRAITERDLSPYIEHRPYLESVPNNLIGQHIVIWREHVEALVRDGPAEAELFLAICRKLLGISDPASEPPVPTVHTDISAQIDREEEFRRVVSVLNEQRTRKRKMVAPDLDALWNPLAGPRPPVEQFRSEIAGGDKGGRPPQKPS